MDTESARGRREECLQFRPRSRSSTCAGRKRLVRARLAVVVEGVLPRTGRMDDFVRPLEVVEGLLELGGDVVRVVVVWMSV